MTLWGLFIVLTLTFLKYLHIQYPTLKTPLSFVGQCLLVHYFILAFILIFQHYFSILVIFLTLSLTTFCVEF